MIEADETPGIPAPEPEEKRGLAPGKAFLILLAVLVAGAAVVLVLTSGGDGAPGEPRAGAAFQLSDEQALERFHELWALDERARTDRDPSLISLIYTSDSESGQGAADALRDYLQDDLYDRSDVRLTGAEILSNSSREVLVEVQWEVIPCILDARGNSVLIEGRPRRIGATTTWALRPEGGQWNLYDKRTSREEVLDEKIANACP